MVKEGRIVNKILDLFELIMLVLLYWLFTRTKFGLRARPTMQDADTARAMGVNTDRMYMLTFGGESSSNRLLRFSRNRNKNGGETNKRGFDRADGWKKTPRSVRGFERCYVIDEGTIVDELGPDRLESRDAVTQYLAV